MTTRSGPIYEVTLFVDSKVVADCDRWLEEHVRQTQRNTNVADCHAHAIPDDRTGRAGRICQYRFASDEALDEYLDDSATAVDAEIASLFDTHAEIRSRVLREELVHDVSLGEAPNCLNCGAHLRGQYCGHCGQRSRSRLISLWELISDAFGDLFELDSRLWQTVVPLLLRPGRLTYDYLQGRRARYMPPFRMYLVMSLIFFVVAFFDPRDELGLFFEPVDDAATVAVDSNVGEKKPAEKQNNFFIVRDSDNQDELDDEEDCDIEADGIEDMPEWFTRRLSVERLSQVCKHIQADGGKSVFAKLVDNTPVALIVLLPLMAFVLKALYPLSRRYYVEHLLFFVHFHAFVFLLLTLQILFIRFAALVGMPDAITTVLIVATALYVPAYVFMAMRRVYEQGRFFTFLKYVVLVFSYVVGFSLIMAATFAFAAFSI